MKLHQITSDKLRRGVTLLELVIVISIIVVLSSMTFVGISFFKEKAARGKSQVFIAGVSRALDEYKLDEGVYPDGDGSTGSSKEVYEALYGDMDGDGEPDTDAEVYLSLLNPNSTIQARNVQADGGSYILVDGWKNEIFYRSPGDQNPDFDLWSSGKDGETNTSNTGDVTNDDIDNWSGK